MRGSAFESYHPALCICFYGAVIGMGVFMIDPIFLLAGGTGALSLGIITAGRRAVRFSLTFLIPVTLAAVVINSLVNHRGSTILFSTANSYVTLEAAVYGLALGLAMSVTMLWFVSFNRIMTSDKIIFIFGRIMPAASLIFSMAMRFVPEFKRRLAMIAQAQEGIGCSRRGRGARARAEQGLRLLSIMFTWSLENSMDTADSMKARGYGLEGRTSFSIYSFDSRDLAAALIMGILAAVTLTGMISGSCHMEYYPVIAAASGRSAEVLRAAAAAAYLGLCMFPSAIQIIEYVKWKKSKASLR